MGPRVQVDVFTQDRMIGNWVLGKFVKTGLKAEW